MNEKKKRGIVVPVMALAVCAVAMVGLGFALETSVTSDLNVDNVLMVDLAKKSTDLPVDAPSSTPSDHALDFGVQTTKNDSLEYQLVDGQAYLKVYGNVTGIKLSASASFTGFSGISSVDLSLYKVTSGESESYELYGTISTSGTLAEFTMESGKTVRAGDLYLVKITGIGTLTYTDSSKNLTGSWSGNASSLLTYKDTASNYISYTFKATNSAS